MARLPDHLVKRCDCAKAAWPTCCHPWHLRFPHNGREWRLSLHREAGVAASKTMTLREAVAVRNRLIGEIEAGKRGGFTTARLTVADACDRYLKAFVHQPGRRPGAAYRIGRHVEILRTSKVAHTGGRLVPLGELPLDGLTKAHIEDWRERRRAELRQRAADAEAASAKRAAAAARLEAARAKRKAAETPAAVAEAKAEVRAARAALKAVRVPRLRSGVKDGEIGINRMLARLRHLCGWCVREGLTEHSPFKRAGYSVIALNTKAEAGRSRRLSPDEEARLLAVAAPHLRLFLIGLLETGCRPGELLSLQFADVDFDAGLIRLRADRTKTNEARLVPMTARLRAVLEMRRTDPDGEAFGAEAFVFGDEVGRKLGSIKTAWRTACRKAGVSNLHPHDCRREFASRLLETPAVGLHLVRDWLGHANIKTTSRYLSATLPALQAAAEAFEAARESRPERYSGESRTNLRTPAAEAVLSASRPVPLTTSDAVN